MKASRFIDTKKFKYSHISLVIDSEGEIKDWEQVLSIVRKNVVLIRKNNNTTNLDIFCNDEIFNTDEFKTLTSMEFTDIKHMDSVVSMSTSDETFHKYCETFGMDIKVTNKEQFINKVFELLENTTEFVASIMIPASPSILSE